MGICSSKPNIRQFQKVEADPPPLFSFATVKQWVYVLRCIDGDTIRILMTYNKKIIQLNCRLAGIDTNELRSKCPNEVILAQAAKAYLSTLIEKKMVWMEFTDKQNEKYGRQLVWIYQTKPDVTSQTDTYQSINFLLVQKGYAHEYDGRGKKPSWSTDLPPPPPYVKA